MASGHGGEASGSGASMSERYRYIAGVCKRLPANPRCFTVIVASGWLPGKYLSKDHDSKVWVALGDGNFLPPTTVEGYRREHGYIAKGKSLHYNNHVHLLNPACEDFARTIGNNENFLVGNTPGFGDSEELFQLADAVFESAKGHGWSSDDRGVLTAPPGSTSSAPMARAPKRKSDGGTATGDGVLSPPLGYNTKGKGVAPTPAQPRPSLPPPPSREPSSDEEEDDAYVPASIRLSTDVVIHDVKAGLKLSANIKLISISGDFTDAERCDALLDLLLEQLEHRSFHYLSVWWNPAMDVGFHNARFTRTTFEAAVRAVMRMVTCDCGYYFVEPYNSTDNVFNFIDVVIEETWPIERLHFTADWLYAKLESSGYNRTLWEMHRRDRVIREVINVAEQTEVLEQWCGLLSNMHGGAQALMTGDEATALQVHVLRDLSDNNITRRSVQTVMHVVLAVTLAGAELERARAVLRTAAWDQCVSCELLPTVFAKLSDETRDLLFPIKAPAYNMAGVPWPEAAGLVPAPVADNNATESGSSDADSSDSDSA